MSNFDENDTSKLDLATNPLYTINPHLAAVAFLNPFTGKLAAEKYRNAKTERVEKMFAEEEIRCLVFGKNLELSQLDYAITGPFTRIADSLPNLMDNCYNWGKEVIIECVHEGKHAGTFKVQTVDKYDGPEFLKFCRK